MSYEKHTWETGEIITAEKLNNLENGVASGGGTGAFMVKFIFDMQTGEITGADKTLEEIYQACKDGKNVIGLSNYILEDDEEEFSEAFSYFNLNYISYSYEINESEKVEMYDAFFEQNTLTNHNPTDRICDLSVTAISYSSNNGISAIESIDSTNKSASSNS